MWLEERDLDASWLATPAKDSLLQSIVNTQSDHASPQTAQNEQFVATKAQRQAEADAGARWASMTKKQRDKAIADATKIVQTNNARCANHKRANLQMRSSEGEQKLLVSLVGKQTGLR